MDPTVSQQAPTAVPPSRFLRCSVLTGNKGWSHSLVSSYQWDATQRPLWVKLGHRWGNFGGTQRPRCRPASLGSKRHLENRDQEPTSKHFLSEDKMAARFNSLSLDNDHIYSSNGFPVHDDDPKWQQAYARLKELQQRLSQEATSKETSSAEENEFDNVIVDGEFIMENCPMLTHPSFLQGGPGGVGIPPREVFCSLNPCTEVVLWSPHGNTALQTIRTLMALPSSLSPSAQPQQDVAAVLEEMET
ncbi:Host cell factor C1 regulator 1 [Varanus komodoensis]|uniref:host cell factor C1 regulator 1 n=1 Tax=Varanus komodoensis TaxID=61221 RepID=UPI001CF7D131|nr:host cell factor C1 regulator 1 [Varanus komodoensis]KAF7238791.1 Host cell factor C1 regulator 1 [Varanus komodoensis]